MLRCWRCTWNSTGSQRFDSGERTHLTAREPVQQASIMGAALIPMRTVLRAHFAHLNTKSIQILSLNRIFSCCSPTQIPTQLVPRSPHMTLYAALSSTQ